MRALKITYPKQKEDEDKLKLLNETYENVIQSRINDEMNAVNLNHPVDTDGV